MKHIVLAVALLASSASISVFAQSSVPAQSASDVAPSASNDAPAQGQPAAGKTRDQVYQELQESEREERLAEPSLVTHSHP